MKRHRNFRSSIPTILLALLAFGSSGPTAADDSTSGNVPDRSEREKKLFKSEHGRVYVGDPVVLGAIEDKKIHQVVKDHLDLFNQCYEDALARKPDLTGKVVVRFTINRDGSTREPELKSTTVNRTEFEACLVNAFLDLDFPQPQADGIAIVSYPFLFYPL